MPKLHRITAYCVKVAAGAWNATGEFASIGSAEVASTEADKAPDATPEAPKPLIRTVAAGVCHSDLHFVEGLYPYPLPAVIGHESAGIV